eukprot:6646073-Prymnesium_polylepis.1
MGRRPNRGRVDGEWAKGGFVEGYPCSCNGPRSASVWLLGVLGVVPARSVVENDLKTPHETDEKPVKPSENPPGGAQTALLTTYLPRHDAPAKFS